ncbi:hypothetical protein OIDMADRAFT_138671 [Oidiodendron maius Zn]|uniref:Acyl-CoA dehydrogenase n=1 Tax=Oidiodendron maius (strain Zn) TaxID=913774 RepID=A0A0C3G9R4_OIDMZ|nr:hypothetical protein OIDMADRAFT_138671 [Oidiodendron maius Zn]
MANPTSIPEVFGSSAPYAEPPWYFNNSSAYYSTSHHNLREVVRKYVDYELRDHACEWEEKGEVPMQVYKRHANLGYLVTLPPDKKYMGSARLPGDVDPNDWDEFHSLIVVDELSRIGYWGVCLCLGQVNALACLVILRCGTEEQKMYYLRKVATGDIRLYYAVTEPNAGSDVANIQTTARKEGSFYILDGIKKWVTGGIFAQFCVSAVRTGGKGRGGISLLIVPLNSPGITMKRMENSGVKASGSTLIEFDSVRVPVRNLIGKENAGFAMMMSNFNQERLILACAALRLSRVCSEDAYNHSIVRETFGQKLISHALIQAKITQFGMDIEPAFSLLEQLTLTIKRARMHPAQEESIGGMTALLKVVSMRTLERCVREAQQIMGGIGYSRGRRGGRVEQISRDVRMLVIGGGSEEIMVGLALRQHLRDLQSLKKRSMLVPTKL